MCEIGFKQGEKCIVNAFASTDFKGVINLLWKIILKYLKTRLKYTENYRAFAKLKNMFKTVFKYLINRNKTG